MSNTVSTQTLVDTQHRAVIKFTCLSDGTAESALTKVNLTTLNYYLSSCSVKITQALWAIGSGTVQVIWGGVTPKDALILGQSGHMIFNGVLAAPIENNAVTPSDANHIQFTTTGFVSGSSYTIILELKKVGFDGWNNKSVQLPKKTVAIDPSPIGGEEYLTSDSASAVTKALAITAIAPTSVSGKSVEFVVPVTADLALNAPSSVTGKSVFSASAFTLTGAFGQPIISQTLGLVINEPVVTAVEN